MYLAHKSSGDRHPFCNKTLFVIVNTNITIIIIVIIKIATIRILNWLLTKSLSRNYLIVVSQLIENNQLSIRFLCLPATVSNCSKARRCIKVLLIIKWWLLPHHQSELVFA